MPQRDSVPCLEYKSTDGAWYEVSLQLENDKLIIYFEGDFAEAPHEDFSLENIKDLQDLETAFRLPSRQLIDQECEKVTPGMVVCASRTGMDKRTFDARVEKVTGSKFKHISVDGEEQCNCIYEVLWLAGPYERERTSIYCENIFLLQSKKIQNHPVIKDVVKYLLKRKDYKSQVALENSSQTNIEKIGDTIGRPKSSQVIKPTENMNGYWPFGARQVIDIEEDSGELKLTPTDLKEMEGLEEGLNYKPSIGSTVLQKLFSSNDKHEYLVQKMIYGIPGNHVSHGEDTDSNLCFLKQENRDTLAAACKSEGNAFESDSIACIRSLIGDAKDGSGGWIDDDSPRIGKNYDGNLGGNIDNDCSYLSRTVNENLVNRNKEDNCNKSPSLVIFEDDNGDMQIDSVFVSPPNTKVQDFFDAAKNEGAKFTNKEQGDMVKNSDTFVKAEKEMFESMPKSCCGHREDLPLNPTSKYTATKDLRLLQCKCGRHSPTGLHGFYTNLSHDDCKHHCYFCRSCCPCHTHFHLSHEYCVECGRHMRHISMNVCPTRRGEELFSSSHIILLENLDKDVNPSEVLSIILQAGVDFAKVYVSPPQSFQNFTRGLVCFKDQESFQRVSTYLQNENIIVTSSNGRPWVIIDAENELSEGSFGGFSAGPKCCEISSNKFKICRRGTPEYECAKRLKGNFLEWWEDLKRLHQELANGETAL